MSESIMVQVADTSTPGADSNTYNMFNSVMLFGARGLRLRGIARLNFTVENSHSGTLKAYMSKDSGTTWIQFGTDTAVAAAAATDVSGPYDYLVDTYWDVKLDWVNGGSAQTTWVPLVTLVKGDRASGT